MGHALVWFFEVLDESQHVLFDLIHVGIAATFFQFDCFEFVLQLVCRLFLILPDLGNLLDVRDAITVHINHQVRLDLLKALFQTGD